MSSSQATPTEEFSLFSMPMKRTGTSSRRNWLDLPQDVMILIFSKLDTVDILWRAQFVCIYWQQLAHERHLFSSIYLRSEERSMYLRNEEQKIPTEGVAKILLVEAVNRSCGESVEISMGSPWCNDKLFRYVVHKSKSLKVLRLSMLTGITEHGLMEAFKNLPLLEEFEMTYVHCSSEVLKLLGRSCSRLKTLQLQHGSRDGSRILGYLALDIAECFPRVQSLSLTRNIISRNVLRDILDRCSLLENLYFRECYTVKANCDLEKKFLDKFGDFPCLLHY
ncbi:hypothetical protein ACHQM5_029252 [Ranunculus cassubicifolius]